jgi:stalled ribosome alternative rescue factor ArfA
MGIPLSALIPAPVRTNTLCFTAMSSLSESEMTFHRKGRKERKGKENYRRERERAQRKQFQADLNSRFFFSLRP